MNGRVVLARVVFFALLVGLCRGGLADERVLAEGNPPLTQKTVDQFAGYFQWILDVELTEAQRDELRRLVVDVWEKQDASAMRGIQSLVKQYRQVEAAEEATRDFWREENQAKVVQSIRGADDPASKWALAVYEAAHQPLVDGDPPLTRQMADAQLEVLCFMAAVVRGAEPVAVPKAVKDEWAGHLQEGWASLNDGQKKLVANTPLLWAAIRAGWPQMPNQDKEKWRRQWEKDLGPLLKKVEQPAVGNATGGSPQDALSRALDATEKKSRELDEQMQSSDPTAAQKAALERLQHQQATYQMISNISRMQFQTSQAIISNMNAGWHYEYRYR
jgi:hypothetical protein